MIDYLIPIALVVWVLGRRGQPRGPAWTRLAPDAVGIDWLDALVYTAALGIWLAAVWLGKAHG